MHTKPANSYRDGASGASDYDALDFFFRQSLAHVRVATLVKVLAVSNAGGVTAAGTVDIQPLIPQIDGQGNVVALPPLYGVPYMRILGGSNAVILDPQVGDIGIACFADRDLSNVIASKATAPPGSNRRHSLADALYIGGVLNGVPSQYVQFTGNGINVVSPTAISVQAPQITLQGAVTATSTFHVQGAQTNDTTITATGEVQGKGVKLSTHLTSGVTTGSSNSGLPVPG